MYPPQVMKATVTFRPRANSPMLGGRPVGQNLPGVHPIALLDDGLLIDAGVLVGPFVFGQLIDLSRWSPALLRLRCRRRSGPRCATRPRLPPRRRAVAVTVTPESAATALSMPVPTTGQSVVSSGTAWRCMLDPMRARLASSFSRKGMSAAATLTSWLGETSMILHTLRGNHHELAGYTAGNLFLDESSVLIDRRIGLGDGIFLFLGARSGSGPHWSTGRLSPPGRAFR